MTFLSFLLLLVGCQADFCSIQIRMQKVWIVWQWHTHDESSAEAWDIIPAFYFMGKTLPVHFVMSLLISCPFCYYAVFLYACIIRKVYENSQSGKM